MYIIKGSMKFIGTITMANAFQQAFQHLLPTLQPAPDVAVTAHIPTSSLVSATANIPTAYIPATANIPTAYIPAAHIRNQSQTVPDVQAPVEFTAGKRGSQNAIWEGHRYTKERQRDQKSYWKCVRHHHGCPGRHNGFRSLVNCSNPTIWKFLEALKLEQAFTDVKITKHLTREAPEPRQKKWIKFDQQLNTMIENYEDYEILDYLKVIGCMVC
jgi:hypothetical protein